MHLAMGLSNRQSGYAHPTKLHTLPKVHMVQNSTPRVRCEGADTAYIHTLPRCTRCIGCSYLRVFVELKGA